MERGLLDFLSGMKNLECLDLSENEHLRGTLSFDKLPASLKDLNLETCYRLESKALQMVSERCPNLEILNIHRDDMVSPLVLNYMFANLKKFVL